MQPAAEPLGAQLAYGEGSLLVGDLGLVVVKALLENGVGYVVTGFTDPQNPIDAAIDDCRRSVLQRRGVLLRRLRTFDALADVVRKPGASATGDETPMRGVVVWNGVRGLRPALERFANTDVPGPVVGICFDPDVARSQGIAVLDPQATPGGVVQAIDNAFAVSAATGRPALVLIRERTLALRGIMRCRDNISPADASALDAAVLRSDDVSVAVSQLGVDHADGRAIREGRAADIVFVTGAPMHGALLRVQTRLARELEASGCAAAAGVVRAATVVEVGAPGVLGSLTCDIVASAPTVVVVEDATTRMTDLAARACDAEHLIGARVADGVDVAGMTRAVALALADSNCTTIVADHGSRDVLVRMADPAVPPARAALAARTPRRGERMHRPLPPAVAAGLVLAQASIGVPVRTSDAYPTYRTDRGTNLTVTTAAELAAHGPEVAAPDARTGVFVVVGALSAPAQQALAELGASLEMVDGADPQRVATAIAGACATPRMVAHVIVVAQSVPAPVVAGVHVDADAELLRTDRLAPSAFDAAAIAVHEIPDDAELAGPAVVVADPVRAQAGVQAAASISPAFSLVESRGPISGLSRALWSARRRMVRAVSGVDL